MASSTRRERRRLGFLEGWDTWDRAAAPPPVLLGTASRWVVRTRLPGIEIKCAGRLLFFDFRNGDAQKKNARGERN